MTAKLPITLIGVVAMASGVALLIAAAALAFESGMIADSAGTTSRMTPVESAMWVIGMMLTAVATVALAVGAHTRAQTRTAREN